jgi:hypothetical protein
MADDLATYAAALHALDKVLERETLRLRLRYQLSFDELRGLYTTDEQVDDLLANAGPDAASSRPDIAAESARDLLRALDAIADARWRHLCNVHELAPLERALVLLAFAPELDLKYETLFGYLNNDITRKWPTLDLARRLLAPGATGKAEVSTLLAPGSTLWRSNLIELLPAPASSPSHLQAGLALHRSATRFLVGQALHRDSWSAAREESADESVLAHARVMAGDDPPVLLLCADDPEQRRDFADALAATLRLPLRRFAPGEAGTALDRGRDAAATLALEQRLEPCAILLEPASPRGEGPAGAQAGVPGAIGELRGPLLVEADGDDAWRALVDGRRVLKVLLHEPPFAQRATLWTISCRSQGLAVSPEDCAALADRYALTARQIAHATRTARDLALLAGEPLVDARRLHAAARAESSAAIGTLGSRVDSRHHWDDLIVGTETLARLQTITSAVRSRHVVYGRWGFGARDAGGTGVKALFAGPSGTGKTMAAGIIARELGLDLFRIDLAAMVSKWLGETEKNLNRVFAAARAGNAMTFFDEADALFGKRSEVKEAHDRYANIEVSHLLQKLEAHDGAVVLASNLKRNMDDAFTRRLHYVVEFPAPDAVQRERLWRTMFPPAAPLAGDIDFGFLARQFELSGGDIRNVILEAAFLAAHATTAIGMRELVRALSRQLAKEGKMASLAAFQRYLPLLRDTAPATGS